MMDHESSHNETKQEREERDLTTIHLNTKGYPDAKIDNRKVGDTVTFIMTGRVKEVGEMFTNKDELTMTVMVKDIQDQSPRSDLDENGRVK